MKTTKPWARPVVFAICGLFAVTAAADPALQGSGRDAYLRAYHAFTHEQVHEGAVEIIELLRAVPSDDLSVTESLVGPSQLLGFAIASLMTWPERYRLLKEVLMPEDYPTDALAIGALEYMSGIPDRSWAGRLRLRSLAESDHIGVSSAAAYILGYGNGYEGDYLEEPYVRRLLDNHPELDFARIIVEIPVYNAVGEARQPKGAQRALLAHASRLNGAESRVFSLSPGLARAAHALPSMSTREIDSTVMGQWGNALLDEGDSRARYTLVSLLAKGCATAEDRARARPGLEALAAQPPATPDVLRARSVLSSFARADHDAQTAYQTTQNLVALDILPATPERSMYEVVMHTSQHASDYFTRFGHINLAIQTHEVLAAKFPGTALARSEAEKAAKLRSEGLRVSIEAVLKQVDNRMRNAEKNLVADPKHAEKLRAEAVSIMEEIIANTPNQGLRAALIDRLNRIDDPVPPPPPVKRTTPQELLSRGR